MNEKLAYQIVEAARATGLSRSSLYRAMNSGALKSFHVGARRLIWAQDLEAFLQRHRIAEDSTDEPVAVSESLNSNGLR
jgi:excisionase family DNA binding protein